MKYPKWKFKEHDEKPFEEILIYSPEQEKALGEEWHDSPADFGVETHPTHPALMQHLAVVPDVDVDGDAPRKRGRPRKVE